MEDKRDEICKAWYKFKGEILSNGAKEFMKLNNLSINEINIYEISTIGKNKCAFLIVDREDLNKNYMFAVEWEIKTTEIPIKY